MGAGAREQVEHPAPVFHSLSSSAALFTVYRGNMTRASTEAQPTGSYNQRVLSKEFRGQFTDAATADTDDDYIESCRCVTQHIPAPDSLDSGRSSIFEAAHKPPNRALPEIFQSHPCDVGTYVRRFHCGRSGSLWFCSSPWTELAAHLSAGIGTPCPRDLNLQNKRGRAKS
ncbi:unnamed protein product [Pleuronectes platessa]|uniref:Uncharacterized protein n=1 Tax=Pleuronectes platessa TaxID=8262 RepID=A0A9N7UKX5_PLEPL|nr:unnamed protein product [Pleuronectes platessa]